MSRRIMSAGPLGCIYGSKKQLREKYITLSQEKAEDCVLKESLLQHAEHYLRISNEG